MKPIAWSLDVRRVIRVLTGLPWYPVLIAAAFVLNLWVVSGVSVLAAARSLTATVAAVGLVIVVVSVITRRPHVAGVATGLCLGILLSRGPIYVAGVLVLAIAAPVAMWVWGRIRHRPISWLVFTRGMNVLGGLLLVVVLAGGVPRGTFASIVTDLQQGPGQLALHDGAGDGAPNIYVLLLDGYPRADWLERLFGGDNRPFREGLVDRGFEVAPQSTSNYMFTQLTLVSMLHMRPVAEIEALAPVLAGTAAGHPLLRNAINENPVFEVLRGHGYQIVTSSPGYEHVALRSADAYLDDGQLNDFEYELLRSTILERLILATAPDFIAAQKRDRVMSGFEHFDELVAQADGRTFGLVHVPVPHLPVVFTSEGGAAALPRSGNIFGTTDDDLLPDSAYVRQLAFVNSLVLGAVDRALARHAGGEDPVIIVMSDHGAERRPQVFTGDGTPGHYANFFASYTPGVDGLFPEDQSPINLFPRLFNHYLGTEFPTWPDERYPWIPSP